MAYTRVWSEAVNAAKLTVRQVPTATNNFDLIACDIVSSKIASAVPFKEQVQTIAPGSIPLVDGVQDYSVPTNIWELTDNVYIVRTDTTPDDYRNLDVVESIAVDLQPRSYRAINQIALQRGVGQLRLESAVQVPTGVTLEIQGEYRINPTKVTALTDGLWFDDKYFDVAVTGLQWKFYDLVGDPRAGAITTDGLGHTKATGKLAEFIDGIWKMRVAEEFTDGENLFPAEPLGMGRDFWVPNIFGT